MPLLSFSPILDCAHQTGPCEVQSSFSQASRDTTRFGPNGSWVSHRSHLSFVTSIVNSTSGTLLAACCHSVSPTHCVSCPSHRIAEAKRGVSHVAYQMLRMLRTSCNTATQGCPQLWSHTLSRARLSMLRDGPARNGQNTELPSGVR